jgi:hypothetical protein
MDEVEVSIVRDEVEVSIVRYVDDDQPGWVACELVDASGRRHNFVEKVPVVYLEYLDALSPYPLPGAIACEVVARWEDDDGRQLARIDTLRPFGVESTEEVTEFVVLAGQVKRSG